MKITNYETLQAGEIDKLDEDVNRLIGMGYQPYGNPYFVQGGLYTQAMVVYETSANQSPPPAGGFRSTAGR